MATYEKEGQLTYKDEAGNLHLLHPKTKIDCVDGLQETLNSKRPDTWTPSAVETGAAPATADSTYKSCYYRMVDDVKEWINPPMIYNTEYRTTERNNGKAVYTKLIYAGAFPPSGNMDVLLGELSAMPYAPFREEVTVTSNDGLNRRNHLTRGHWSDKIGRYLGIEPPSNASIAGFGVAVTIWYTKD